MKIEKQHKLQKQGTQQNNEHNKIANSKNKEIATAKIVK